MPQAKRLRPAILRRINDARNGQVRDRRVAAIRGATRGRPRDDFRAGIATMTARRWLRWCGLAISIAAVTWIALRFARGGALDLLRDAPIGRGPLLAALLAAAVAYAFAMFLPAFAWWRLLVAFAAKHPPARPIMATYAVSQYGKYLPGNVAHYALRHAWSRRFELPHAGLALASILEAALLLLAALGLTLLADTRQLALLSQLDPRLAIALLALMLVTLAFALHASRRANLFARLDLPALPSVAVLVTCLMSYAAFFVVCAFLLDGIAYALGIGIDSFAMLLGASAASWLAGFVVIGAPGGLGVREAAFVALAGGALGESHALLLIGLFRVVTFLGDTLFFAAGAIMLRGTDPASGAD
jgi:glycosyltransferase 2 family protein